MLRCCHNRWIDQSSSTLAETPRPISVVISQEQGEYCATKADIVGNWKQFDQTLKTKKNTTAYQVFTSEKKREGNKSSWPLGPEY